MPCAIRMQLYEENNSCTNKGRGEGKVRVREGFVIARKFGLNWKETMKILKQVAAALVHFHDNGTSVYVDLKPENILIDRGKNAFLCDFGAVVKEGGNMPETYTKEYSAPEVVEPHKNSKITKKVDSYSFGIVVLQLIMQDAAILPIENGKNIVQKHIKDRAKDAAEFGRQHAVCRRLLQDGCSKEEEIKITDVALRCARGNPEARPSMKEIQRMLHEI
ncbi:hypothetical protein SLEP1_g9669 [Rubroshorea leprosula]|uniref:Protein kinase domain-containing protein n=1 Tax=Rubroshorea leprosula TaxID=152421 RepID=A0AAV5IBL9_9ROSI|nr:hypothetical protein SLEP1_g9669 [Rubroshorea leprosula]